MTIQSDTLQAESRTNAVRCISLKPYGDGWAVILGEGARDLAFLSASEAETAAKRLGQQLACAGHRAEIRVFLRSGELAGRFICAPVRPSSGSPMVSPFHFETSMEHN